MENSLTQVEIFFHWGGPSSSSMSSLITQPRVSQHRFLLFPATPSKHYMPGGPAWSIYTLCASNGHHGPWSSPCPVAHHTASGPQHDSLQLVFHPWPPSSQSKLHVILCPEVFKIQDTGMNDTIIRISFLQLFQCSPLSKKDAGAPGSNRHKWKAHFWKSWFSNHKPVLLVYLNTEILF